MRFTQPVITHEDGKKKRKKEKKTRDNCMHTWRACVCVWGGGCAAPPTPSPVRYIGYEMNGGPTANSKESFFFLFYFVSLHLVVNPLPSITVECLLVCDFFFWGGGLVFVRGCIPMFNVCFIYFVR